MAKKGKRFYSIVLSQWIVLLCHICLVTSYGIGASSYGGGSSYYRSSSMLGYGGDGFMSDMNPSDMSLMGGRMHQTKCVDIPSNMTLCRDIGYTQMRLPNLLEHDTLREVCEQ